MAKTQPCFNSYQSLNLENQHGVTVKKIGRLNKKAEVVVIVMLL